jgi:hypothetical protein
MSAQSRSKKDAAKKPKRPDAPGDSPFTRFGGTAAGTRSQLDALNRDPEFGDRSKRKKK